MAQALTKDQVQTVGRMVEQDLWRYKENVDAYTVQRVLEAGRGDLYRAGAQGSDAQFSRIVAATKAARTERDDTRRVLGR